MIPLNETTATVAARQAVPTVERRAVPPPHSSSALVSVSNFATWLALLDVGSAALTVWVGWHFLGLRVGAGDFHGVGELAAVTGLAAIWMVAMAAAGGYSIGYLIDGAEEARRVANACVWLVATFSILAFVFQLELSRAYVLVTPALIAVLTLVARYVCRKALHRRLAAGAALHRLVMVGDWAELADLRVHLERASYLGMRVAGLMPLDHVDQVETTGATLLPVDWEALPGWARECGADTIVLGASGGVTTGRVRRLSWALEGTGIELVVAPALTDVAGPRINVRHLAGLPLLHVEQPRFAGAQRIVKSSFDRGGALIVAVLLLPVMALIALAVRCSGPGPLLFSQERIGLGGERFTMWKFRTMRPGAEAEISQLMEFNEHDGPLFKIHRDPRVTSVGRWLRRFSLDELPQLWNVLSGSMSLVGPRPPLPREVEQFDLNARRRFLVKPGITGLWQINGRSDLVWQEAVRLDLYYIENWSIALDLTVLWKTGRAVLQGRGAH